MQKLELTWIEKENRRRPEPRLRIEFAEQPEAQEPDVRLFEAVPDVCGNPRCGCTNILLQLQPAPSSLGQTPARPPHECWLDINEKSLVLTPEQERNSEYLRLSQFIRAELTDADQQRLREWFLAEKLELIQTTPISKIDITDLPDADDGKMIGFVDVFPCGLALNFTLENEAWAVDEQYCVQPECRCKETILSFLKLKDAAGHVAKAIRHPPAIRYNYRSQDAKPTAHGPAGSASLDALLVALKREQPTLDTQLELRHLIMQSLYARHYLERTQSHLRSLSAGRTSAAPRKVGRNEPCPCGSGRKYKHCCLDRPAR